MKPKEQISILAKTENVPSFGDTVKTASGASLVARNVEIFQINVGKLCNMTCKHCHVEAGPDRTEIMTRATLEKCVQAIAKSDCTTVDITGGAPEMNPDFDWFIAEVAALNKRIIVRSNLTVLKIPKYAHCMDLFVEHNVEVVASLPSYEAGKTDQQRGNKTFERTIDILQQLNARGYGKPGTGLVLNLVHNPVGAFLPGSQADLETEYKRRLFNDFQIEFNHLFCITNMPISRFLEYLLASGNYDDYMIELVNAFNPAAVESVMCRNTVSVSWDGRLFDCDFNQMLDLPVVSSVGQTIDAFCAREMSNRPIVIQNHCYGCTAGAGSSCQGALK